MKNVFLILFCTLISAAALADENPVPICNALRKGSVHFTVYKYRWIQHADGGETNHEVVCDKTIDLNITNLTATCNPGDMSAHIITCPVILDNKPTSVTVLFDADVISMPGYPPEKAFFASYYIGNHGIEGKHRQTSIRTRDLRLKDATLYIPAENEIPGDSYTPDDLALEITFGDPNAQ